MAVKAATMPTILDVSREHTSDGSPLKVAEILTQRKPIFEDIPWVPCNTTNGHRLSVETGLPEAVLRKLNAGVAPSKGATANITEATAEFASLGKIDKAIADINGEGYRVRKNSRHIEAIGQKFETTFFKGNTNEAPESFLGVETRYGQLSGAENTYNIISASGTTHLFSIWLIGWGMDSVYGIYSKGSKAGIGHTDYGVELVSDGNGGEYPAYRDWFTLNAGIAVEDWRDIVRVCNIDKSALLKTAATGADLIELLSKATSRLEHLESASVKPVFYVPREVEEFLTLQAMHKANMALSLSEAEGRRMTMFRGIPIRRTDALNTSETQVV